MASSLTYKKAGVDIAKANKFVDAIKVMTKTTLNKSVLNRPNSFGALFGLNLKGIKDPVLVSSTDGVGTKLLVADLAGKHDTVGIDLVAMNVNDVLCTGARPLFFLDYMATGRLNPKTMQAVMKGIVQGCRLSGCALIGGETAEMPDMYKGEEYDLAGFTVGIVDRRKIIDGSNIEPGNVLIGLPSSGLHSNGYSLARKALTPKEQKAYAEILLKPTCIYVKPVLALLEKFNGGGSIANKSSQERRGVLGGSIANKSSQERRGVLGMAHITGGAWFEKLTKVLPKGLAFEVQKGSWPVPRIFQLIQDKGNVPEHDMYRTFNMGIGFALVVREEDASKVQAFLRKQRVEAFIIGNVVRNSKHRVVFN